MVNKKDRRHSGRVYPRCNIPQRVLDEEGIVIEDYWDDWVDYRDGFRDQEIKNNSSFRDSLVEKDMNTDDNS